MHRLVFAVVAVSAFAGCTDDAALDGQAAGAIAGMLLDDALRPVPGGELEVLRNGVVLVSALTDDGGRFFVAALEPGSYMLTATAAGHNDVMARIDVHADATTRPLLQTHRTASDGVYAVTRTVEGHILCAVGAGGALFNACYAVDRYSGIALLGDRSTAWLYDDLLEEPRRPDVVQAESYWESTQRFSERLHLRWDVQAPESRFADCSSQAQGESPMAHRLDARRMEQCRLGDPTRLDRPRGLQVEFFPGDSGLVPAGLVLEQSTQTLFTVFYGWTPPSDWLLGVHGLPS